jgi:autotransporter-associated beta strand protein
LNDLADLKDLAGLSKAMPDPNFPAIGAKRGLRSAGPVSLAILLATTALGVVSAQAGNATWLGNNAGDPNEWTEPANWSATAVPDGTATFTNTGQTTVANDNGIVIVGTLLFTPAPNNAQAYTFNINNPVILNGSGIVNNSTNLQTFNVSSGNSLVFQNGASASGGSGTGGVTINNNGGFISFQNTSTAGTATIVNAGILQFNDTSTAGAAHITNSIETDFFDATSAGSATIVNNGTLTFNSTSTASAAGITNNATVQFNNSSTAGSATITTNNGSQVVFSNSSSGGNARFITNAGGFFDISGLTTAGATAGSIEGAGSYVLGSKTLTTGSNNLSTAVDGVISGTGGGLTKVGTGTMTLTNSNTYTGATTVSAGTLALSGGGSIASSSVVTVNATFDISASAAPFNLINTLAGNASGVVNMGGNGLVIGNGSTEFAGVIQGTGGLEVIAGTQTLSGVNTYSNATQIDAGATLALKGAGSIASSSFVGFSPGGPGQVGTLDISQTTTGASVRALFDVASVGVVALGGKTLTITLGSTFDGVIQDGGIGGGTGGNLVIANGAVQALGGTNTYTGTTTIAAGGELDLVSPSGSIATSSGVINNGWFDISLLGTNTSIKSLSGAATGVVNLGSNVLTITNANGNFAGVIQDSGGPGGLALSGGTQVLSGTNTYTGNTTINGGKLVVDGSIAASSQTTVNAGGTLAGSGTVGNTAIAGGTLAPGSASGSPFGPLTVQGSLTFTAASTYLIQANPANAARTNVTGAATLGNATVSALFAPGNYVNRQYTILNATSGFAGTTFNPTVISSNPNLKGTLSYDPYNVFLNIKLAFVAPAGLSTNQQNVANTLTNFFNTTGSIPANFALLNAAGLTVASGELGTGVIQSSIKADDLFLNLLLDPTVAGRSGGFAPSSSASQLAAEDDASAYAEKRLATPTERAAFAMATKAPLLGAQPANRWSVWGAGYGGSATTGGNAVVGSQDTTARVWGVVGGADYKVAPNTLLGFAVAGGGTNYSLANALGSGRADVFQAGVFGRHTIGPAYLSAALAYGWHDVTTNRTVALAGFDQLQGRFQAETFSARFEGGYRFATPFVGITPYAAAQAISFRLPPYAEQAVVGTPQFALNYAGQTTTATRSELGLRTDKSYAMQDAMLTLRGRAAWAHDYNPDRAVTALFQALPGTSFVVNGARGNPDAALVSAGAEVKWLNGFSLAGTFEGEFSGNTTSYAGKGVAKYSW